MTRLFIVIVAALLALLVAAPSNAGTYGYNYGYGYKPSYGYNYYPTYYYPTLPTYGYSTYYPSYSYTPTYYTPTYYAPSYSATNYKDGNYHYHSAGTYQGVWYPAGNYAWIGGQWVGQYSGLATPVAPKDWKETMLQVAAKRDEYNAYIGALKAMGVSPPPPAFQPPPGVGMGSAGMYGVNQNAYLGTYGSNASTLYGYTYSSVKDLYGDTNLNALFQQAQQLAGNAQALGGEATKQFQEAVTLEGGNRARVAEAIARGQAAAAVLRAAQGSESHQSQSTTTFGPQPPAQAQASASATATPAAPQMTAQQNAFVALATKKCLPCHGGEKTEGKFDIQSYFQMSAEEKAKRVWPRLTTEDKNKRMPKDGDPLTPEELKLFFSN